jgi:D-methionine transport system ATP-binding protein
MLADVRAEYAITRIDVLEEQGQHSRSAPPDGSDEVSARGPITPSAQPGVVADPIVRFAAVSKHFSAQAGSEAVAALDSIDLDVPRSSILGIIGRSGAGKSTLIRLVNGLERPSTGRVIVDDVEIAALDGRALRQAQRATGMIFQHFNLLSSRTAYGNIALPLEIAGWDRTRIKARAELLLDLVGLADKRNRYPAELSGGQKQRIGIARALATSPKVLLSDEATSALDPETTQSILALLTRVNVELGVTILLITHEIHVIKEICHRVAVLDAGRIVEQGDVFDVFARPRHPTTKRLMQAVTDVALPDDVAGQLLAEPKPGGSTLLQLIFTGVAAEQPAVSRLGRDLGIDANIIAGQIHRIAGRPFSVFVVTVPTQAQASALQLLAGLGAEAEVIGYVA